MAQLLLMCTLGSLCKLSCILDVIYTGSGFVPVLNIYLAVSPLMSWAIEKFISTLTLEITLLCLVESRFLFCL